MNDLTAAEKPPNAARSPGASARFDIMLSRNFGSEIGYKAKEQELHASFIAEGIVWRTEGKFESRLCHVTFYRDQTRHSERRAELAHEHGLEAACGTIEIALRRITIEIGLNDNCYSQMEDLLRSCITNDHRAKLSVEFSHHEFKSQTGPSIELNDLTLAAKVICPIIDFNLQREPSANTIVCAPKYKYDSATTANLTLNVRTASIQAMAGVSTREYHFAEIELNGKMLSQKLGVNSDDNTIEIKEYEKGTGYWDRGYPAEAFPGIVSVLRTETCTNCTVTLYATKEILKQLATLLSGMSQGDTVWFDVSMIAEGLPLTIGERKEFFVTHYQPVLQKAYS